MERIRVNSRSAFKAMSFIIALIASFVSLYQNKVMLLFGLKEGAIFYAPFRFGLFFFVEQTVIWAGLFGLSFAVASRKRRALMMLLVSVGIIGACETVMADSTFKWDYRDHMKTAVLKQITVDSTRVEKLAEGGFKLTYALKFPKDGHYLTFPAYFETPIMHNSGKYEGDDYEEAYTFMAGKPYAFVVRFPDATANRGTAYITICDSKDYDMSCHQIPIKVRDIEQAAAETK